MKAELGKTARFTIHDGVHPKRVDEAPKLAFRHWLFHQVDEVGTHTTLRKESLCLACVGALPHAEDLDLELR